MLSILLGFVFFCLIVWCFIALIACGLLPFILYTAIFLIGIGILAFANTGLFTSILGLAFIVIPNWIASNYLSDNYWKKND